MIFEIAKKYGRDIDLHQYFKDDYEGQTIGYLCEKTIKEGYQGRVSVGHLTSLGAMPERLFVLKDGHVTIELERKLSKHY